MRAKLIGIVVALFAAELRAADCGCGYPSRRPAPCPQCCQHVHVNVPQPQATPQAVTQDAGAFAAPPRSGTTFGASQGVGVEGFGLHFPAMSLRLPTLQLPSLVRYRTPAYMRLESANAPHTLHVQTQFGVDAPNTTIAQATPQSVPGQGTPQATPFRESCTQGSDAVNQAGAVDSAGAMPTPPQPQRQYTDAELSQLQAPPGMQIVVDPATGRMYSVVLQPIAAAPQAFVPAPVAVQAPVPTAQPMFAPAELPPAPAAPPVATVAAPTITEREWMLLEALRNNEQRTQEMSAQVRHLESMIQDMHKSPMRAASYERPVRPPVAGDQQAVVPFPPVAEPVHHGNVVPELPLSEVRSSSSDLLGSETAQPSGEVQGTLRRWFTSKR